ncbi:5-oxoprolinase subunit PxpB [Rossellomorea sp. FS2]|uniref:5-oxoprolinase subunit PxpB n=1 Tax=Rossellomorea TaxID=2837508 RepID=UPI0011E83885|nr:5-oxoprolinase subunit PxpB [Rossellomorea marisflavi]TYO69157.1 5-oxoprolinase subunit PxpB [Rossellomorea marisflavi]USK92590.1 5-oxoprolinase subunit PxpB [Rossellomorea marisflavi]
MDYSLRHLGDHALVIEAGSSIDHATHVKVRSICSAIEEADPAWITDIVPAFTTVTLHYDPMKLEHPDRLPYETVMNRIHTILSSIPPGAEEEPRTIEIPVCYGGDFGPDLESVAEWNDLTPEKVIELHSGSPYLVHMIGFSPGFPYLGGMPEEIATPRRKEPRLRVPRGSVGIAGSQTGIYPLESPGGWQLIGRTPVALFDTQACPPGILQAGDRLRFKPITPQEYKEMEASR